LSLRSSGLRVAIRIAAPLSPSLRGCTNDVVDEGISRSHAVRRQPGSCARSAPPCNERARSQTLLRTSTTAVKQLGHLVRPRKSRKQHRRSSERALNWPTCCSRPSWRGRTQARTVSSRPALALPTRRPHPVDSARPLARLCTWDKRLWILARIITHHLQSGRCSPGPTFRTLDSRIAAHNG
jgi:hypothetical protein